MLREVANIPMGLGDSLLLSGIGMLVVFMELIILALMILLMSKVMAAVTGGSQAAAPAAAPAVAPVPVCAAPALTLTDVSEPTAAAVMAIVSHQTGIPLNRLAFRSIRGVVDIQGASDEEAAVIMALTADKMGVPVNKLVFKSIKRI